MSFYHIIIEANDHISKIEEKRDIELFNIENLTSYLHSLLLPAFNKEMIELEDENIKYEDLTSLKIYHTLMPIEFLIEEEQKELPSETDITITAHEIFNDRDLSYDVTQVIFDMLDAAKIDRANF
ncbi:hypothetical protein [Acinetobacter sp. HY1485]|uniref:hypothetical protein n=1 Tax=Acinetobacter sp. HY1485 TaxID=2970918 RepID=UPI0022B965B8|nr:hypothetical protein [Acinetobacter sp. HY1485]